MDKWSINPRRLSWFLEYHRIGLEELAAKVKIRPATLRRALDGKRALSYNQLCGLADKLGVSQLFFSDEAEVNAQILLSPQFRDVYDSLTLGRSLEMARLIKRVEWHQSLYKAILEEIDIDRDYLSPQPFPSFSDRTDFAANGDKVRQWLGIKGCENFAELRRLVEAKNIMVFAGLRTQGSWRVPDDEKGWRLRGFALDYETLPAIFVAKLREEKEQAFTMMHELGHLIMHKGSKVDDANSISFLPKAKKGEEWEANMLASHILLPERTLQDIDLGFLRCLWPPEVKSKLRRVCEECCVSTDVVLARLCLAGKMSRECYERYVQQSRNASEETDAGGMSRACKERIHVLGSRYIVVMLEAMAQREITTHKAIVYLDTKGEVFDELDRQRWW